MYTGPGQDVETRANLQKNNSKLRLALCWSCAILNFDPFTERPRHHLALHSHHSPQASVTKGEHTRTEFTFWAGERTNQWSFKGVSVCSSSVMATEVRGFDDNEAG